MITFLIRYPYFSNDRKHATQDEKNNPRLAFTKLITYLETFLKHDHLNYKRLTLRVLGYQKCYPSFNKASLSLPVMARSFVITILSWGQSHKTFLV